MAMQSHSFEPENDLPVNETESSKKKHRETLAFRALEMSRDEAKKRKKPKKDK
ncbi:MAG: hypothetical protein VXW65_13425 [Pseudomonadota bacterium]|nr:hypothetical protein [Pseudomonadota bacterium]